MVRWGKEPLPGADGSGWSRVEGRRKNKCWYRSKIKTKSRTKSRMEE